MVGIYCDLWRRCCSPYHLFLEDIPYDIELSEMSAFVFVVLFRTTTTSISYCFIMKTV